MTTPLADKVFGQKREATPTWNTSSSLNEQKTGNILLRGLMNSSSGVKTGGATRKSTTPFGISSDYSRQRSQRAQDRLHHQRDMYERILANPDALSVDEIKQKALVAATAAQQKNLDEETLEEVFEKACKRLFLLWDQLAIEDDVRQHIRALALQGGATVQGLSVLHDEIQRLSGARAAEQQLAAAIETRESFVYLLQEAVEIHTSGEGKPKNVANLINNIRISSFEVVEATIEWRKHLGYDAIYLWRGTSYLVKMANDLAFFATSPLVTRVQCAIMGNPMLNPVRKAERLLQSAEGGTRPTENTATEKITGGPGMNEALNGGPGSLSGLPALKFKSRGSPFGMLPTKKNTESASTLLYTPDRYADCEATLRAELDLLRSYFATRQPHSFDDYSIAVTAEPDPAILKGLEDIKFVPEDIDAALADAAKHASEAQLNRKAAIIIQKSYRGRLGRIKANERALQHACAKKIQGLYRYWAARRRAEYLSKRKHAASKLQALTRGAAARASTKESFLRNSAASKIQALARGHACRKNYALWKTVWHAAIAIQRTWRSHLSRRRTMAMKSRVYNSAASEIQKIWKAGKLRETGVADPKRLHAAIRIQRHFRGWMARRYTDAMKLITTKVILIQSIARMYVCKKKYKAMKREKDMI